MGSNPVFSYNHLFGHDYICSMPTNSKTLSNDAQAAQKYKVEEINSLHLSTMAHIGGPIAGLCSRFWL